MKASHNAWRFGLALAILSFSVGCNPSLPDPDSDGAQLFARRCAGCHRLYAPGSMTYPMWALTIKRMQGESVRRGIAPLTTEEEKVILEYLRMHGGNASQHESP